MDGLVKYVKIAPKLPMTVAEGNTQYGTNKWFETNYPAAKVLHPDQRTTEPWTFNDL